MSKKEENFDTDKLLINTSAILLVGFLGLSYLENIQTKYTMLFVLATIILLFVTIALCLWHRYRVKIRFELYSKKVDEFTETLKRSLSEITLLGKAQGREDVEEFFKQHSDLVKGKTSEEVKFFMDLFFRDRDKNRESSIATELMTEGLGVRFERLHKESFKHPLDEKFGKGKYYLDLVSSKYRYHVAVFGLISFLIAVVLLVTTV
jgi:hypothetical protein